MASFVRSFCTYLMFSDCERTFLKEYFEARLKEGLRRRIVPVPEGNIVTSVNLGSYTSVSNYYLLVGVDRFTRTCIGTY